MPVIKYNFKRREYPLINNENRKCKHKRYDACGLTNTEYVNQYNLKHINDKGTTPEKNRLKIPLKDATQPGPNANYVDNAIKDYETEEYSDIYEDTYSEDYNTEIDPDAYNLVYDYEEEEEDDEFIIPETNVAHTNVENKMPEPTVSTFHNNITITVILHSYHHH